MHFRFRLVGGVAAAILGSASLMFAGGSAAAMVASASGTRHAPALGRMLPAPGRSVRSVHGYTMTGSYNWSGYAQSTATEGEFTAVQDTWTVPTVNTSLSGNQYSSDWVGIGGFSDSTLVQAGTEADNIGGTAVYDAWTEILPAAEVVIPGLTIHPGDRIKTIVKETSPGVWKMKVKDLTTGQHGGKTVDYSSSGESVEAIHERPCIADGCTSTSDLATLSETNNVTFDPGKYSVSGAGTPVYKPLLKTAAGATVYQMWMVNDADTAYIAATSNPDSDNDGFTVAYGSTQPSPPAS